MRDRLVKKANGQFEPFSENKLLQSAINSGLSAEAARSIVERILPQVYDKINTKKLYQLVRRQIRRSGKNFASRYGLKSAIAELGPDGFYFEKFIGSLWITKGYVVSYDSIIPGKCVTHEVDALCKKGSNTVGIESKFYNLPGKKCDIKTTLYVFARALDLNLVGSFWLVTNTKFSEDSIKYANCAGLRLLSWDHPKGSSIKEQIDQHKLYPITCLVSANKLLKKKMLNAGLILCSDLLKNTAALNPLGINLTEREAILGEASQLLNTE